MALTTDLATEMIDMKTWLFSALTCCVFTLPASAQDARPAALPPPSLLFSQIQPGGTPERTRTNAERTFRGLDANGDGKLDAADSELHRSVATANLRVASLTQIMNADLNGDGAVTEAELQTKQRYEQRHQDLGSADMARAQAERNATQLRDAMAADLDGDGRITADEVLRLGSARAARADQASHGPIRSIRDLLEHAGADTLSAAQFTEAAAALFKSADTDGNGTISQDEFEALQKRSNERQRFAAAAEQQRKAAEAQAACALPKPSATAKALLLSAYQGDALSTTTIGSQDIEVRTASIVVEDGTEPLYVVAVTHSPMIWRFSGAVERIERVVLSSQSPQKNRSDAQPITGASNLPADKVTILPRATCLSSFSEHPSIQAARTVAVVKSETGRDPVVATRYAVSEIAIPSAKLPPPREPLDTSSGILIEKDGKTFSIDTRGKLRAEPTRDALESEIALFFPGGIVEIDPATVVASDTPSRYEVLPSKAGLLQLVRKGALSRNSRGEFLINEKIRFPAGLYGAHSARFLLLDGVPAPDGNPGHSCAVSEATGKPLTGSRSPC